MLFLKSFWKYFLILFFKKSFRYHCYMYPFYLIFNNKKKIWCQICSVKKKKKKRPWSGKIKHQLFKFWRLLDCKKFYLGQSNWDKLLIKFDFLSILSLRIWLIIISTNIQLEHLADLKPQNCCSAKCKRIQDSLGFWIPRRGICILGTGF